MCLDMGNTISERKISHKQGRNDKVTWLSHTNMTGVMTSDMVGTHTCDSKYSVTDMTS